MYVIQHIFKNNPFQVHALNLVYLDQALSENGKKEILMVLR